MRLPRLLLPALLALGAAGCAADRATSAGDRAPLRLALAARLAVAGRALDVRSYYLRPNGATVDLGRQRLDLVSGTQQLALTIDPARCLADAGRVRGAGGTDACVLGAVLTLIDESGRAADSTVLLPVELVPGDTRTVPGELTIGQTGWKQVATGAFASCGLWRDGAAYCWGNDDMGQLGGATAGDQRAPVRVATALRFARLAVGYATACGLTAVGEAHCWGLDANGMLGRGAVSAARCTSPKLATAGDDLADVRGPQPCSRAVQPVQGGIVFRSLAIGALHACGVAADGRAWCWGTPALTGSGGAAGETSVPSPRAVAGGLTFESLAAGPFHTCGVATGGAAYCWGSNRGGALGTTAVAIGGTSAVPVAVQGGVAFQAVSAGAAATCGVARTGEGWCWGSNANLQLGLDARTSDATPRPAPARIALQQPLTSIGTHWQSSCAAARSGAAFCWGNDSTGALGLGTVAPQQCTAAGGRAPFPCSPTPAALPGAIAFARIEVGFDAACGVTALGAAYCWGGDDVGQLGAGRPAGSPRSRVPLPVRTPAGAAGVALASRP